jgi:hypothetical protein
MTFESYTYKQNPKKVKEDNRDTLYVALGIVLFILVFIFLFRGWIAFLVLGGMSYTLIQLKLTDIKKKGPNRLGRLAEKLTLTKDLLTIDDKSYRINEMSKFEIDADDYLGKPGDFLGTSAGIDNFIEFSQGGTDYSIQFQVKRMTDLKLLGDISKEVRIKVS